MKKRKVFVGEIALIPTGEMYVPCKVLYLSHYFKDVILLGIYGFRHDKADMPIDLPDGFAHLVYTSQVPILKNCWLSVGHEALRITQQRMSKRIVGGDVWLEDDYLGPASDSDIQTLPRMSVLGTLLVERRAAAIS